MSTNESEVFEISLTRTEEKIKLRGEDGVTKVYTVREMTGAERDRFISMAMRRMQIDPNTGKSKGVTNVDGLQASLITRCLYDDEGKPVPEATISIWPASAQEALYKICQRINGLGDSSEELTKND